jgi:uncharacterized protein DUF4365
MKKLTASQLIGQRGEFLVAERAMAIGFAFDVRSRLETGVDGMLELRDPKTGRMLAQWVGAQVKTTESGTYSREDDRGFDYLLNVADLEYWRGANIPVILVLVRLDSNEMYWKVVDPAPSAEQRRVYFDRAADRFETAAADRIAALCISRDKLGTYVPPMLEGENVQINMVRILLPQKIYVAASLFASGREAARELAKFEGHASYDWVIRDRRFISFRNPEGGPLMEVLDEGSLEEVETAAVALSDDLDDENAFIELLGRTLSIQLDDELSFDRESRALYFRAKGLNRGRKYRYRSLVNETSAEVVSVWRRSKDNEVGSVRHHAFIPRFHRIGDEWLLTVTPTFIFTKDGYRPHYHASALLAGKKKKEKNGAVRGQFLMWRYLLVASGNPKRDLLSDTGLVRTATLGFEALEPIVMPLAVPEEAWKQEDPNADKMEDQEWLL